jgi:hypothetical protein
LTAGNLLISSLNLGQLIQAAGDFRYLLNRGYPRSTSLTLVGNRYNLEHKERQLLQRGVFDDATAGRRAVQRQTLGNLTGCALALDGHNVLITLECGLRGVPLIEADDGFIRDIGEVSRTYRTSSFSEQALLLVTQHLCNYQVYPVYVWYDAPLSHSGELAQRTREIFHSYGLAGEAWAIPVPEKELLAFEGVVATSDTAIIDQVSQVADVAGEILRSRPGIQIISL